MRFRDRLSGIFRNTKQRKTGAVKQGMDKIVPLLSDTEFLATAAGIALTGIQLYKSPRRRIQMIQLIATTVMPAVVPYVVKRFTQKK